MLLWITLFACNSNVDGDKTTTLLTGTDTGEVDTDPTTTDTTTDTDTDTTTDPTGERYHPAGWVAPEVHGMATKFQTETDCRVCHGDQLEGNIGPSCESCHGAGWDTTCTFCHGGVDSNLGAPPEDIDDNTDLAFSPYIPHTKHLESGDHADISCDTCHVVPDNALTPGHLFDDPTAGLAEVTFSELGTGGSWNGASCTVYCHGNGRISGTITHTDGPRDCTSCHASPTTPTRWGEMSGEHRKHLQEGFNCSECHSEVITAQGAFIDPSLHVNGEPDVLPPITWNGTSCTGVCHGENHNNRRW